jgi:hypothetical protein
MSKQRENRKEVQHAGKAPLNFTCGKCRRVHEYDEENPYECPDDVDKNE